MVAQWQQAAQLVVGLDITDIVYLTTASLRPFITNEGLKNTLQQPTHA